jgi:hypothetical protein
VKSIYRHVSREQCLSARGSIGLVLWNARVGDKVFVLKGERRCSYCARWIEDLILMN